MIFPKIFTVIAKPNSRRTEYKGIDDKGRYMISIKEKPEDNKANIALIKFFKKEYRINARIKSGLTGREKILEII